MLLSSYTWRIPTTKSSSHKFTASQNARHSKVLGEPLFQQGKDGRRVEGERTRRKMSPAIVEGWGAARAGEGGKMENRVSQKKGHRGDSFYTTQVNLEGVRSMGNWLGGAVAEPQRIGDWDYNGWLPHVLGSRQRLGGGTWRDSWVEFSGKKPGGYISLLDYRNWVNFASPGKGKQKVASVQRDV